MKKMPGMFFGKVLLLAIFCGLVFAGSSQVDFNKSQVIADQVSATSDEASDNTGFEFSSFYIVPVVSYFQNGVALFPFDANLTKPTITSHKDATGPPVA